jgi:hypothetical protein
MVIKEKKHRLPKEFYRGEISVALTLCIKRDVASGFSLSEIEIVNTFSEILSSIVSKEGCIVPVYPVRKPAASIWNKDKFLLNRTPCLMPRMNHPARRSNVF